VNAVASQSSKQLQFWAVRMDNWYATKEIMLSIEKYQKIYYCPLKDNRQVDDSNATHRTDYVVTNDMAQDNTQAVQEVCSFRWKVDLCHFSLGAPQAGGQ
jgi:hypothetical protein